jgi:hypothetical protein
MLSPPLPLGSGNALTRRGTQRPPAPRTCRCRLGSCTGTPARALTAQSRAYLPDLLFYLLLLNLVTHKRHR